MWSRWPRATFMICILSLSIKTASNPINPTLMDDASTSLSLSQYNTTNTTLQNNFPIECFPVHSESLPFSVDTCRPSLNEIRTFPDFGRRQVFITGEINKPFQPHPPPYDIYSPGSECNISIMSTENNKRSYFSFKDARAMATEIIQHCEDTSYGRGGFNFIGVNMHDEPTVTWAVAVFGMVRRPGSIAQGLNSYDTAAIE